MSLGCDYTETYGGFHRAAHLSLRPLGSASPSTPHFSSGRPSPKAYKQPQGKVTLTTHVPSQGGLVPLLGCCSLYNPQISPAALPLTHKGLIPSAPCSPLPPSRSSRAFCSFMSFSQVYFTMCFGVRLQKSAGGCGSQSD